jgi:hypothetical protein
MAASPPLSRQLRVSNFGSWGGNGVPIRIAAGMLLCALSCAAQVKTEAPPVEPGAKPVRVETVRIHGSRLEGNLEGNAVDREALVFLPPSYERDKNRRYPVVYALHGYSIGAAQWAKEIHVPQTIEGAFARGVPEMIVVLPDSKTVHNGSMYSSSVTVGDFERLKDDVGTVRGWWRNRVARTFVVFFLTSLGTAIGVWVAGFRMAAAMATG